jgi:7-cyano-7-deazaguanine synthase
MTKALVLLSGGVDSMVALELLTRQKLDTQALFVRYGQASADREWESVQRITMRFRIQTRVIDLRGIQIKGGYIPARNAMLLNAALMILPDVDALVTIGIHAGTTYADCTPSFVERMQSVFDLYTAGRVRIHAPLLSWTKSEIWAFAVSAGLPIERTYSCELGENQPCGRCLSCSDIEALSAR